jgi:hypothetical protein
MRPCVVTGCIFGLLRVAHAQSGYSAITGRIITQTGTAATGAAVTARNLETGFEFHAALATAGTYTLAELPVGRYSLSVTAPAFKTYQRQDVALGVAQVLRIDIGLEPGAATDLTIQSAPAPLLTTQDGEVRHDLAAGELNALPVLDIGNAAGFAAIRNPYAVVQLLPGTSYFTPDSNIRLNGTPSNSQSFRIEGQDATSGYSALQSLAAPSVDAMREIAVQTGNYAAEFGQTGGGLFNVAMRSGGNQLHGSAYDYVVNEVLNAGIAFTNDGTGNLIRARQRRTDYGFRLGGPVYIPKVYDGRNRAFFIFNFEQFRETQTVNNTVVTVPTLAYRNGDFRQALTGRVLGTDPLGRPILENTIYNPDTDRVVNGVRIRDPFANNAIPFAQLDPVALKIQALIPAPSFPGLINNYRPTFTNSRLTYIPSVKADYLLSANSRLSAYWSRTYVNLPNNSGLSFPLGGMPNTETTHTVRLNFDRTMTPALLLHVGAGILYPVIDQTPTPYDPVKELGLKGTYTNLFPTIRSISQVQGGGPNLGPGTVARIDYTKPTANASVTWVRNNHTYKAGAEAVWNGYVTYNQTYANGWLVFSPNETGLPSLSGVSLPLTVGYAYASFLMGRVDDGVIAVPSQSRLGSHGISWFVQDNWRVTSRLALDYGLRYDFQTYLREQYGRLGTLGFNTPNPSAGGLPGDLIFEGHGGGRCNCEFGHNYPWAFGPRIGAAFEITPKTVLRAGVGVFYYKPDDNYGLSLSAGSQLNYSTASFGDPAYLMRDGLPYTVTWPNFSPGQIPLPGTIASPAVLIDPNAGRPARQVQWNVALQRELARNLVIEAAYVGNRGAWWNAPFLIDLNILTAGRLKAFGLDITNPADRTLLASPLTSPIAAARGFKPPYAGFPLGATVAQSLRPYPQFGNLVNWQYAPLGDTWYDSLQVKATKRYSHGLDLLSSFTWQKQLTIGAEEDSSFGQAVPPQVNDIQNRPQNKYLSAFDQPFLFVLAGSYTTPRFKWNRIVSWAVHDWQLGVLTRYASGLPIRVPVASNGLNSVLFRGTFANRIPSQPLFTVDLNCHCFDPTRTFVLKPPAWANPAPGAFGTSAAYYGDYRYQRRPVENMSFGRNFRIKERAGLEFRVEFTNIFNRTEVNNPSGTNPLATQTRNANGQLIGGFGLISTASLFSPNRQGMLVGRFTF